MIYLMYGSTLNQMASTRISRNNKKKIIYNSVDIHFAKAERSCLHYRHIERRLCKRDEFGNYLRFSIHPAVFPLV